MTSDTMSKLDSGVLLGYLLNALDDRETSRVEQALQTQPHLQSELAVLRQDLSPLERIRETVPAPPQLSQRTCAKIWANKRQVGGGYEVKRNILTQPKKKWTWVPFIASVALGMLIAFTLFPIVRLFKRGTIDFVTNNYRTALQQKLDPYEEIYGTAKGNHAPNEPVYAGQFPWISFKPSHEVLFADTVQSVGVNSVPARNASVYPPGVIRGQEPDILLPVMQPSLPDNFLIITPERIRSGTGQTILFKDGQILFRDLPE